MTYVQTCKRTIFEATVKSNDHYWLVDSLKDGGPDGECDYMAYTQKAMTMGGRSTTARPAS